MSTLEPCATPDRKPRAQPPNAATLVESPVFIAAINEAHESFVGVRILIVGCATTGLIVANNNTMWTQDFFIILTARTALSFDCTKKLEHDS